MHWIVYILICVGVCIVTAFIFSWIQEIFGFSETTRKVINSIVNLLICYAIYFIWMCNPAPKYTGNPESDCYIFKERVVEHGDVNAAVEELMDIYFEKGLGMPQVKETVAEFGKRGL